MPPSSTLNLSKIDHAVLEIEFDENYEDGIFRLFARNWNVLSISDMASGAPVNRRSNRPTSALILHVDFFCSSKKPTHTPTPTTPIFIPTMSLASIVGIMSSNVGPDSHIYEDPQSTSWRFVHMVTHFAVDNSGYLIRHPKDRRNTVTNLPRR